MTFPGAEKTYLELIIEVFFGINVDAQNREIIISPNLPEEIRHEKLAISDLMVLDGIFLDVRIDNSKVHYHLSDDRIRITVL